jgi:ABC-type transporter MlaC component
MGNKSNLIVGLVLFALAFATTAVHAQDPLSYTQKFAAKIVYGVKGIP